MVQRMPVKLVKQMSKKKPPEKNVKSIQFDLFKQFVTNDQSEVSNSIDIWESIPKYFINEKQAKKLRYSDGLAQSFKWEYHYNNTLYMVKITPAQIEQENGKEKAFFPGPTEELVEEALKKILTDQSLGLHVPNEYETWVKFTLKMIYKELLSRGRSRSITEIKHAIQVMNKCNIALYKGDKEAWSGSILQDLVTVDRGDYIEDPSAYHIARLPLFVSNAINKLQYRQYNYSRLMQCKDQLSGWIYRRLINHYKQAGPENSYHTLFSSLEESGLLQQGTLRDNRKKALNALETLVKKEVIERYDSLEKKEGRKIVDVKYTLYPSAEFVKEQKAANKRASDNYMRALNSGITVDKG